MPRPNSKRPAQLLKLPEIDTSCQCENPGTYAPGFFIILTSQKTGENLYGAIKNLTTKVRGLVSLEPCGYHLKNSGKRFTLFNAKPQSRKEKVT